MCLGNHYEFGLTLHYHLCTVPLFLIALGCSAGRPEDNAEHKIIGEEEWTLQDGAVLRAEIESTPIDQCSSTTTLIVRHKFRSRDGSKIEKLDCRFAESDGSVEDWYEIGYVEQQGSDIECIQIFKMPFSAPTPWIIDFRVTKDTQTEELKGWHVIPD